MVKCEAQNGACNDEAIQIMYVKGWEGESDMPICDTHKTELLALQDKRPKGMGKSPYRFKELS